MTRRYVVAGYIRSEFILIIRFPTGQKKIKTIIHSIQMRSKVFLTRDIKCSASASGFGQSGYIYRHKLKKKLKVKFCTKNEQLNATCSNYVSNFKTRR